MLTEDKKQANVQLDLSQAETILCEQCQNGLFLASFFLKRISALVSPTGKEAIIPIQVYSCGNCGHINNKLNPTLNPDEETKTDN
jgi:ribosomal protein S27AE